MMSQTPTGHTVSLNVIDHSETAAPNSISISINVSGGIEYQSGVFTLHNAIQTQVDAFIASCEAEAMQQYDEALSIIAGSNPGDEPDVNGGVVRTLNGALPLKGYSSSMATDLQTANAASATMKTEADQARSFLLSRINNV
jgi:hypothetical protein